MSTLSQLMNYIDVHSLPIQQIYYGFNDSIDATVQPFATMDDFKEVPEYDTGGVVFSNATFRFHVLANRLELAEDLALAVDAQWNLSSPCGPSSLLKRKSYEVVQEALYVFHVLINYELFKDNPR